MSASRWRRLLDAGLWAVLAAPIAANQAMSSAYGGLVLVLAAMAVAVGLSRTRPLLALVVVVLGSLFDGNFVFAIPVLSYLVGRRTARTGPALAVFTAVAAGGTLVNLDLLRTAPSQWLLLASILLMCGVFPWLAGRYRAQQVELATAGWERAERLERERQMVALRERARIAQDMHDSLGHQLALVALRAAALQTAPGLAPAHRAAADEVRRSAADATDRLHDIIGVLREDAQPAPVTTEDVDELVRRARASGVAVQLARTGPADSRPVMVDRAIHRIVQEALTNATRHAPGAAVTVELAHEPDATTIAVTNDPPPSGPLPAQRSGVGLVGLRERVRVAGGTFTAGEHAGGFRVAARLPHHAAPAQDDTPVAAEHRQARRRARRSLVVAVAAPAAIAAVLAAGYYPIVAADATLPPRDYDRIPVGAARADLAGLLPRRQVAERPTVGVPAAPPGAVCEFYTDGNFPLASATYRLCFAGGRLVAKDELR
ncbi:histidine kinase [Dactylosporangium sp. AC04546]|uniref:sensor histidine kinase n=1 Tax=Dactylosporangium sp. AC04546 TaxID=2862460 RepID=UPI001EE13479|nr:sensor histidine kinase [Dactylosporangium sp. AC04546]WVK88068.1 histidine kinase [Dactylosporangium sp. AC04546]